MSLITLRAPGTGRRQAGVNPRLAAENLRLHDEVRRLKNQLEGAGQLIGGLRVQLDDADEQRQSEVAQVVRELDEERAAHQVTRGRLAAAIRANAANAEATTVQTDVTALRAAPADWVAEPPPPLGPLYAPYHRVGSPTIRVVPLWDSPQAAHPAAIHLAGAR